MKYILYHRLTKCDSLSTAVHDYIYMYCTLHTCRVDEYEAAVEQVRARYLSLPLEAQSQEILADFERRWKRGKEFLLMRRSRTY